MMNPRSREVYCVVFIPDKELSKASSPGLSSDQTQLENSI